MFTRSEWVSGVDWTLAADISLLQGQGVNGWIADLALYIDLGLRAKDMNIYSMFTLYIFSSHMAIKGDRTKTE